MNEQQQLNETEHFTPNRETKKDERKDLDFELISQAGGELIIDLNVPRDRVLHKLPCSVTDVVRSRAGQLEFHSYKGLGFTIWLSIYNILYPLTIKGRANYAINEWHCFIENCFKSSWDKVELPEPKCYQTNLTHSPWVDNVAEFQPGRYVTCDFHIELWLLEHYAKSYPILYEHVEKVKASKDKGVSLTADLNILPDSLRKGINDLIYCRYPENLIPEFYEHQVKLLFMEMLQTLSKRIEIREPKKTQQDAAVATRDYIVANPSKDLSISTLAQKVFVSEPTLCRAFKKKYGITIHKFVMQERLDRIMTMLRDPLIPLDKIGEATIGTTDPNYLFEFWKRYFPDITPREWRIINVK